jgi:hypothetical protein
MTATALYGYAPRNHNLTGFYDTTAHEVQIDTVYSGDLYPMMVPPRAMPIRYPAGRCKYCGVIYLDEDRLCESCGAPI